MNRSGQAVDTLHLEVVGILLQSATLLQEVISFAYQANHLARTIGSLYIEPQSSLRIAFSDDDFVKIDVAIGGR